MVICNDFEAHECIAMDSEKIRPLRWFKSVPDRRQILAPRYFAWVNFESQILCVSVSLW